MTAVIKIGGALLRDPRSAAISLREMIHEPAVVVHGGGVQITRMLERFNARSEFVDGLRVTDENTLHLAALALVGEVHTHLVQSMLEAGLPAIGMFGALNARKKEGPWGFVGTGVESSVDTVSAMLKIGKVVVIPTLANGSHSLLNVNGDETASALAVQLHADRLVFLTDVAGVMNEAGHVIDSVPDVNALLSAPFVSGGMLPKLRAVKAALVGGVQMVRVGTTGFAGAS